MPSNCANYPKSASDRENKLKRAIQSVLEQSNQSFELIVVSDGCDKTVEITREFKSEKIVLIRANKQVDLVGVGRLRNLGISKAQNDWITYLDSDDVLGENHLQILSQNLNSDWLFYNDYTFNKYGKYFEERECIIKSGRCGTSNITHLRSLNAKWQDYSSYGFDDWNMIKSLMKFKHNKIETPEYFCCHIPGVFEV
jgi:glycosyltransferase involved in cell wall biosynthesis